MGNVIDNIILRNSNNLNNKSFESFNSNITYKDFFELITILSNGFISQGIKKGDIITLCMAGTLDSIAIFYALNKIGAVTQLVNPNKFIENSKQYIDNTNSKLLIILDKFYPMCKEAISQTNVNKIMITSLTEYSSFLYKMIIHNEKITKSNKIDNVKYIYYSDIEKETSKYDNKIKIDESNNAAIVYTSGSTGNPKGVILTNASFNNMIKIYDEANGFGSKVGDRNLILIPPMYGTSLCHCVNTPLAFGCTNIIQPIYNPQTFEHDINKYKPNIVVGSLGHYISLLNCKKKRDFSFLKMPFCGGEPIPKKLSEEINNKMKEMNIPEKLILGYGMSEFGTMTMFNMNIENRTNESGILMPMVKAKIVDSNTKKEVPIDEKGLLLISTPSLMKEYLNNEQATNDFFETDENGTKWGITGDIASVNKQGIYNVYGRRTDSIIDSNNNNIYLFDIENIIANLKYIKEVEVVPLKIENKTKIVVHLILEEKYKNEYKKILELINLICIEKFKSISNEAIPYAYKIRNFFPTSAISGKRDYESLKLEYDNYFILNENEIINCSLSKIKPTKKLIKKG